MDLEQEWTMLARLSSHLTYANVVASISLFLTLGGTTYALTVPRNSVGTAQLKPEAVTTPKIDNGAVTSAKIQNGTLREGDFRSGEVPAGPRGDQGPPGPQGIQGERGEPGPPGTTSGDAGTLDGLDSAQFLRSDASNVFSGPLFDVTNDLDVEGIGRFDEIRSDPADSLFVRSDESMIAMIDRDNNDANESFGVSHPGAVLLSIDELGDLLVQGDMISSSGEFRTHTASQTARLRSLAGATINIDDDASATDTSAGPRFEVFRNGSTAAQDRLLNLTEPGNLSTLGDLQVGGADIVGPAGGSPVIRGDSHVRIVIDADNNNADVPGPSGSDDQFEIFRNGSTAQTSKVMDVEQDGDVEIRGSLSSGVDFDLAEVFARRGKVEPGDLVQIDPEQPGGVLRTDGGYDRGAIGVVSAEPGLVLGESMDPVALEEGWGRPMLERFREAQPGLEREALARTPGLRGDALEEKALELFSERTFVKVALAGRLPVRADASFGPIKAGDPLTPSPIPGVAMKATRPGPVIGTALEDLDKGTGEVKVFANRTWSGGPASASPDHSGGEPLTGLWATLLKASLMLAFVLLAGAAVAMVRRVRFGLAGG